VEAASARASLDSPIGASSDPPPHVSLRPTAGELKAKRKVAGNVVFVVLGRRSSKKMNIGNDAGMTLD